MKYPIYILKKILLLAVLICLSNNVHAQRIAVKTNVLSTAMMAYNLEGEMIAGNRSTACLGITYGNKILGKDVSVFLLQPEYRYWFNGRPMIREFIGAAALITNYDMTWSRKRYKGNAIGAGLTIGYAYKLTRRINLEATAGFGLLLYSHKESYTTDIQTDVDDIYYDTKKMHGYQIIPTKLGISVSYILK